MTKAAQHALRSAAQKGKRLTGKPRGRPRNASEKAAPYVEGAMDQVGAGQKKKKAQKTPADPTDAQKKRAENRTKREDAAAAVAAKEKATTEAAETKASQIAGHIAQGLDLQARAQTLRDVPDNRELIGIQVTQAHSIFEEAGNLMAAIDLLHYGELKGTTLDAENIRIFLAKRCAHTDWAADFQRLRRRTGTTGLCVRRQI